MRDNDKHFLWQFITKDFLYLTKSKNIEYKGHTLKTDYIINIIHELLINYLFTNEVEFNLYSIILKSKYGKLYPVYIDYLLEKNFITLISKHYAGKKSKTYKLNNTSLDIVKCKVTDNILLKKHQKEYLLNTFISDQYESPIPIQLRKMLIDDLYHVEIDYDSAYKWLNDNLNNGSIDKEKYYKNLNAIDNIKSKHIFFKFDSYGRMHTNFTVLKKHIRNNFLTIDGMNVNEIDIKNSQPLFLGILIKNKIGKDNLSNEVLRYIDSVKNGLIYDEIIDAYHDQIKTRDDAKLLLYKVIFGNNVNRENKETKMFKKLYPEIVEYIKLFKKSLGSYKKLSHKLQLLESNFIFNKVTSEIKEKVPHIKLFTIHDSICYPIKYKEEVNLIFKKHFNDLFV